MASASNDGVRLWDLAFAREIAFLPIGQSKSAVFHSDGKSLITTGSSGLHRWLIQPDPETTIGGMRIGPPLALGPPAGLGRTSLRRNGRILAAIYAGQACLLNAVGPAKIVLLDGQLGFETITISPDGNWVAAGTWAPGQVSGTVRVWDVRSRKCVTDLRVEGRSDVAFSPDGRWLVTGTEHEYRFWRVVSWKPGHRIPRDRGAAVRSPMAFTADGRLLAITRSAQRVELVDTQTARELATLEAPSPQMVSWLGFSPDGSQLAAATENHVIQLWDLRLIRKQLAAMGLDWNTPPYPPAGKSHARKLLRARVLPGELQ
jgi:WD40 repeat protein